MTVVEEANNKKSVLVVDDNPENIHVLNGILSPYYKVKAAINGKIAIKLACEQEKPDIILLDIMMADLDGFAVCQYLKKLPDTAEIPIIFVSAKTEVADETKGFDLGAVDYITKPVSPPIVLARVSAHLKLADQKLHLMSLVKERTADLEKTRIEIVESLGRAAEFKDNETGMHVVRMSWYSYYLAQRCTGNENWSELLRNAARMHDIGKIGIPDEVLLKPGKLDADEWAIMQKHVEYGVEILGKQETDLLVLAVEVAKYHHEKWDGSGYPNGISGEEIPLSARIVAIADVFDALTSDRPYKKAWSVEKAVALIESEAGKHFDPELVPEFKACLAKILMIKDKNTG
ncbi:two-component system response regulator [Psychromonas marina]|uniref:Two-component system response regulator n=1 Tax=Psychromonas marina TaxID=88364 RepID=A0ABQ6DZI7_9GAMM|nr:HD domain-containing phosphohydrolase [Psychromonas marina]GLS90584.1 two-component system response regulator [Psychromonas marina]